MKINLNIFKQYSPFPILKNCFGCKNVKPMYVLDKDVFVGAQSSVKKAANKAVQKLHDIEMQIVNPFATREKFIGNLKIDLNQKQSIKLEKAGKPDKTMTLEYNPANVGTIYKKVRGKTGKPVEVAILKTNNEIWETSYIFMSKDLKQQIGYVRITEPDLIKKFNNDYYIYNYKDFCLTKDFPELGIKGKRIFVDYLKNMDEEHYSGIGTLADRLCVEHCMKKKIKPLILFEADMDTGNGLAPHIAHYKRGHRFMPLSDSTAIEFYTEKYGEADLNKIIEKLLEKAKNAKSAKGRKIDTTDWGKEAMYVPYEKAKEYLKLSRKSPILND